MRNALVVHEIASVISFQAFGESFAGQVLHACEGRFLVELPDMEADVDPVALLHTAVEAAAAHLDHPLEPAEGPAFAPTGRVVFGYVMLPQLTGSPSWDADGDAPLVLSLGREDLHMLRIAYSSGGGFDGPYEPGPWRWYLGHRVPRDTCISETRVIAPALTGEVAAEVGVLTAEVLTGEMPLPR
ncbi:hypothetical protein [Actinomadura fulvescens]|uniref:hypothetical protein n=1 Tax=Actinomadura fulvescens TaxID=46160 RepID=UPI0031D2D1B1